MGVDHQSNYGIGVLIKRKEFEEGHEYEDDFLTYLDDLLQDSSYEYFEVGEGSYTGEENDIYVVIKNPFENGYSGLNHKIDLLYKFLKEKEIEFDNEVDLVGGMHVY